MNIFETQESFQNTTQTSSTKMPYALFGIWIFIFIWAIIGFIAFIMSLVCFGKSGSTLDKILGLLLAVFFGPFYFIFYAFNGSYCR